MSFSRENSLGSDAMEEEEADDEFYGETGSAEDEAPKQEEVKKEAEEPELEDGEEEEEETDEDDEDEINVDLGNNDITAIPGQGSRFVTQFKSETPAAGQAGRYESQPYPSITKPPLTPSQGQAQAHPSTARAGLHAPPDLTLQDGRTYPPVRNSTIIVNGDPIYNGKKIKELEIDADLAEHLKPWRAPGADQSDYFNYGFDEFTWAQYVMRHSDMETLVAGIKESQQGFEAMFSGMAGMAGMSGGGGAQSGAGQGSSANGNGGMGVGMPNENEMMAAMQQMMAQQGINDPSQIDFGAFMQQMGAFGGTAPPQGPSGNVPSGPAGWQQGGGQGGGGRGSRTNRRW